MNRWDIELAGFTISAYGLLRVTALLTGLMLAVHLAHRRGINRVEALKLGIFVLFVALLGTKLALAVRDYLATGTVSAAHLLRSGGGFYYGLIPATAFAGWYLKRRSLAPLSVLDAFSPSVALGLAIARLGCFAAGCCYGRPIGASAGVIFADGSSEPSTAAALPGPVHPTPLYEAAAVFLIFLILMQQFRRPQVEGQVFCGMLMLLAAARFIMEIFRGDEGRGFLIEGTLSLPQLISIGILVAGSALWLRLKKSGQRGIREESGSS
jgi:phosphatidylglycerol:prolipoprotein diacylglycerol transferase